MLRFVAVVSILGACAAEDGPRLDAIAPVGGARGAMVTLTGAGLCGPDNPGCARLPSGAVDFGLTPPIARAAIVTWADDAIAVRVPAAVDNGATTVYVTVDGRSSNGIAFEVLP